MKERRERGNNLKGQRQGLLDSEDGDGDEGAREAGETVACFQDEERPPVRKEKLQIQSKRKWTGGQVLG